jgi:hypothetical protein
MFRPLALRLASHVLDQLSPRCLGVAGGLSFCQLTSTSQSMNCPDPPHAPRPRVAPPAARLRHGGESGRGGYLYR